MKKPKQPPSGIPGPLGAAIDEWFNVSANELPHAVRVRRLTTMLAGNAPD